LLGGPLLSDQVLRRVQLAFQQAGTERERRLLALDFAQVARRGRGSVALEASGLTELAPAEFFERYLRHTKGPRAGEPFRLEPWQAEFVDEFYRRDEQGRRIYRLGLLGVPRGNGKSPLAAGLALYELVARTDSPDVFCAAAAKDQARIVLNFARSFVEGGDLAEHVKVGRSELVHEANVGSMRVLSADGALQHGLSVSAAIVDELWAFTTERQEEVLTALMTALHKRLDSFLLAITTSGWDKRSLLGRMYDEALVNLELERRGEALTVGRDQEGGTLLWWYAAPEGADLDDEELWRACNPASWIDTRDLRRARKSPAVSEADFRRLHLNQWTSGEEVWISAERWAACRDNAGMQEKADTFVGVDASWTGDATAVAWAQRLPDGRVVLRCRVWWALDSTDAHEHLTGGSIDFGRVEDFVLQLARQYRVREVVFDPAYFARSAELLSERGLLVAPIDARSRAMRDAYGQFYEAVNSHTIAHDGDPVLSSHVVSAAASIDEWGAWKVRKRKQSQKIDGLVASVIAVSRAVLVKPRKATVHFSNPW
jgi:phage terminase large subunit-like protein